MMMAGASSVGEEWTWNIVIETMKKLTIEIQPSSDTEQSGEDTRKIKQEEKRREASPGCSAASPTLSYPVECPPPASNDARKPSSISMLKKKKKPETVPPCDLASSSLLRNFDPVQLEEERRRKYQRFRPSYSSQTRSHRVSSTSLSWSWRKTPHTAHTRVHQMTQAGNGGGRAGGGGPAKLPRNNARRKSMKQ